MRFTINLSSRVYLDHRQINRWLMITIIALTAFLAWNVTRLSWDYGELNRLAGEISAMENKLDRAPGGVSEKEYQKLLADIAFYNGIIERKSCNWLAFLDQVEQVTPAGVSLSGLLPNVSKGELKIQGQAKSFKQITGYLEKLNDSSYFTSANLVSHREILPGEKQHGVQFTIACRVRIP